MQLLYNKLIKSIRFKSLNFRLKYNGSMQEVNSKNSTARLDILAAISGVLIAFQSRANGELSRQLDSGVQAALISFSSGLIVVAFAAAFNPKIRA